MKNVTRRILRYFHRRLGCLHVFISFESCEDVTEGAVTLTATQS